MNVKRFVLYGIVGCIAVWVLASYRANKAVAPPLDPFGRAEWYYFASEYEDAAAAYQEALRIGLDEPKAKDARFKWARSLHEGGKYHQALSAYDDFIRRYPTSDEANRAQGHIEWIRQNKGISND